VFEPKTNEFLVFGGFTAPNKLADNKLYAFELSSSAWS